MQKSPRGPPADGHGATSGRRRAPPPAVDTEDRHAGSLADSAPCASSSAATMPASSSRRTCAGAADAGPRTGRLRRARPTTPRTTTRRSASRAAAARRRAGLPRRRHRRLRQRRADRGQQGARRPRRAGLERRDRAPGPRAQRRERHLIGARQHPRGGHRAVVGSSWPRRSAATRGTSAGSRCSPTTSATGTARPADCPPAPSTREHRAGPHRPGIAPCRSPWPPAMPWWAWSASSPPSCGGSPHAGSGSGSAGCGRTPRCSGTAWRPGSCSPPWSPRSTSRWCRGPPAGRPDRAAERPAAGRGPAPAGRRRPRDRLPRAPDSELLEAPRGDRPAEGGGGEGDRTGVYLGDEACRLQRRERRPPEVGGAERLDVEHQVRVAVGRLAKAAGRVPVVGASDRRSTGRTGRGPPGRGRSGWGSGGPAARGRRPPDAPTARRPAGCAARGSPPAGAAAGRPPTPSGSASSARGRGTA